MLNVLAILSSLMIFPHIYGQSICHATGVEEDPTVTQDIRCLWRGGGVALIQTK